MGPGLEMERCTYGPKDNYPGRTRCQWNTWADLIRLCGLLFCWKGKKQHILEVAAVN